ncbi:mRNA-capping enzyme subunit beta [Xylariales sp. AK1849]|nr:mRNA-capping enzyme subunit beta [Xylariales sp. AK1849]
MDLKSMMNPDSGAGGASRRRSQPPPSKAPSSSSSIAPAPQTPIQAGPTHPHAFRDYSQSVHASPGQASAPSPLEYAPSSAHPGHATPGPPGPYASPTTYHPPPGAFASRPAPPPLQPPGPNNDPRSPGSATLSGPSPYRHTPTSSLSATSQGYPFPNQAQNQPPPSPQQRLQFGPPAGFSRDPRDGYGSQAGSVPPPVGMPTPHGSVSYMQGQQQGIPQTPPAGTPGGGNHPYLQQQPQQQHQRSLSMQSASASTPTSAHPQYGTPYGPQGGSPVATNHAPPHHFDHQRQSSQPPTPLGPPLSAAPRQSSVQPNNHNYPHAQPPSPYQQRGTSTPAAQQLPQSPYAPHPQHAQQQLSNQQQQQQQQQQQHSPLPPHPSSIPRVLSNSHSVPYDAVSESHRRSQSLASQARSDRERSISVSPKTRIPSLTSSAGGTAPSQRPSSMGGEPSDFHHPNNHHQAPAVNALASMDRAQRELTPAKRKLEDRDLKPEELEGNNRRPPPPQMNGNHSNHHSSGLQVSIPPASDESAASPLLLPRRKRVRYANPPAWALSAKGRQSSVSRNYVLKSKVHAGGGSHAPLVNGTSNPPPPPPNEGSVKSEHVSRHTSPEATRSVGGPAVKQEEAVANHTKDHGLPIGPRNEAWVSFEGQPFPVEPICLSRPLDYLAKTIADHLYWNVLDNPNLREIQSRNIQFEVEAKLGTIIDRDTNQRVYYPVNGECIINEEARVAFKSSMTESQHRSFNEWLNAQVMAADPRNPHNTKNEHVQIMYKHRREVDRFYELPSALQARLPHVLQTLSSSKSAPKARITTDQKTGDVLAKIIKARVSDLNLHLPRCPLDCRISINLEWEWDGPLEEIMQLQILHPNAKQPDRSKDRLSYTQGFFSIDLTQVTQSTGRGVEKEHELEVEIDTAILLDQGVRLQEGRENVYPDLVEGFVNNIRGLARRCPV